MKLKRIRMIVALALNRLEAGLHDALVVEIIGMISDFVQAGQVSRSSLLRIHMAVSDVYPRGARAHGRHA